MRKIVPLVVAGVLLSATYLQIPTLASIEGEDTRTAGVAARVTADAPGAPLTPEQLISLIEAGKQRFSSFDLVVAHTAERIRRDGANISREPLYNAETIMRWTPKHSYVRSATETAVQQWESTSKWTKKLFEKPDGSETPLGRVTRGPNSAGIPDGYPLFQAVWSFHGLPWEWVLKQETEVEWDDKAEVYVLRVSVQGMAASMTVDPKLGYMPISKTMARLDGTWRSSFELGDFREVEPGLLLPYQWLWRTRDPGESAEEKELQYVVTRAAVNVEIPESLMKVTLPPGTKVDDEIVGERYLIREDGEGVAIRLVGNQAPELDVAEWVKGDPKTLAALKGRTVVLAFSNSQDATGAELVRSLTQLREGYSTALLEIITVYASGTNADELGEFFSDDLIAYRVAIDKPSANGSYEGSYEGATFEKYRVKKVPAIYIIDAEGNVRYQDIPLGAVQEAVKRLLDEQ